MNKRFFKSKIFWTMLFIIVLGTILRVTFIDKPYGLWNDEYVSWQIASIPFGKNFWNAVFGQCHMPFYYLYLKFFIYFFGNNDIMLRLTSVIPGILAIISMYFVGKEFKDEKLGLLCAVITSLSSFLIYFSQEVRFYELLFLFSSLALLFTLKLIKNQNIKNIVFYVLFNFLIIFTHSIGFVYVFFNLILMSILLKEKHKKAILSIWGFLIFLTLITTPLLFKIFTAHPLSQWWGHFTLSKLGFLITDYFSPVLTNIVSAPDKFFYDHSLRFIIFAIIPSTIAITGIIKSLTKKENAKIAFQLFSLSATFLLVLILASLLEKMVFITKYSIEIYPILILLMSFGLLEFKKHWRYSLIFIFCFLNLFYILTSPLGASKIRRNEGHKIVANLLKNSNLKSNDFILLNYYPQSRFEKYFDFEGYNVFSINKNNFYEYSDEKFKAKFQKEILDKLKPNQKLAVIILNDVAIYSPMQIDMINSNTKLKQKTPILFLVFSDLKNQELNECLKTLDILKFEQKGSWSNVTFIKK